MEDLIIRGLLLQDTVNVTAISGGALVEEARALHGLSRVCTAALGRTLLCAAMMSTQFKGGEDRLSVIVKGGGPAGNIVVSARPAPGGPAVKGYIENPALELPPTAEGKLDVAGAIGGEGELVVTRDLGMKEPYVGHSPLVSGEIAEDFAQYFAASEQQPSLVYLGVHVGAADGRVRSAGGILLQPLPNCPAETLERLQAHAAGITALAGMLEERPLEEALEALLGDMELTLNAKSVPRYLCDCSRERLERVLISLGREELSDMIREDGRAELTCHFCNKRYAFTETDLKRLLAEAGTEA